MMAARRRNAGQRGGCQGKRRHSRPGWAGAVVEGAVVGLFLLSIAWHVRPVAETDIRIEEPRPDAPVRVLVVNGCGKKGLAAVFGEKLRRCGKSAIDVVDFASAPVMNYGHTVIIGHGDGVRWLPYFGSVIGCDSTGADPPARPDIDVTIIVGSDFPLLFPGSDRWWDRP